jgi:hypothetical protein
MFDIVISFAEMLTAPDALINKRVPGAVAVLIIGI